MTDHHHNAPHAGSLPPHPVGVSSPHSASDAPSGGNPLDTDLRDALTDLVMWNRSSILKINEKKCPMGICLAKHGYARWSALTTPGKWVITDDGWRFLETRTTSPKETR